MEEQPEGGLTIEVKEEHKKRARTPLAVQVRVVQATGPTALVEWDTKHGPRRGYLPVAAIAPEDMAVSEIDLEAAAPYGCPWEEYIDLTGLTKQAIANQLRASGIWTAADLEAKPLAFATAVLRALPGSASDLVRGARQFEQGG